MVPFRARRTGTRRGVFLALLLLLSGNVAQNPGPICHPQVPSSTSINLASLNVRSAVGKSALIHNLIADDNIDVFALSETWIQQDAPSVIQQDPAPEGFRIIHVHRKITAMGQQGAAGWPSSLGTPSLFAPIHSRAVSTLLLSSFSSLVSARDLLLSLSSTSTALHLNPNQCSLMNFSTSSRPSLLLLATIDSLSAAMPTSLAFPDPRK